MTNENPAPIQHEFQASIGYWVNMTAIAFRRALNESLAPLGLTHRQSQVLCWLKHEGQASQSKLACLMDIEAPTLAGIIDRMEDAGWVKRVDCTNDRRRKLIELEPAAEPVWEKIAECAKSVHASATAGLSEEDLSHLLSVLERVHKNLSNPPEGDR